MKFTVVDGVAGYLAPPRDPQALAARLAEILCDPALALRMGGCPASSAPVHLAKDGRKAFFALPRGERMESGQQAELLLVLATDLDDTLVGDREALAELNSWLALRRRQVFLIYLTGRHSLSALKLISTEALLIPDVLVADVGTIIRYRPEFRRDRVWESRFADRWCGSRIEEIGAAIPGLPPQRIRSPWRRAYHLEDEKALALLKKALANLPVRVVVTGRNVDVIPAAAGKGAALNYLVSRFNLPFEKVLVCGDGGNDLDMLQMNYRSVLVANSNLPSSLLPSTVYRAQRPFAAGILEALRHFGLAS